MKKMLLIVISLFACFLFADEFVESSTTIGGYGELHYDMEANDGDGKLDKKDFDIAYERVSSLFQKSKQKNQ